MVHKIIAYVMVNKKNKIIVALENNNKIQNLKLSKSVLKMKPRIFKNKHQMKMAKNRRKSDFRKGKICIQKQLRKELQITKKICFIRNW